MLKKVFVGEKEERNEKDTKKETKSLWQEQQQ